MKRKLIALAMLGAFAGVANAQSNVTVYGVADIAIGRDRSSAANAANETQMLGSSSLNNGTSRLGFRGTEDLGGGMKASFQLEQGIRLESGANTSTTGNHWDRQAYVSLGGNFGTVSLGRQSNIQSAATLAYDLTGTANYALPGRQFGYLTRTNSLVKYTSPNLSGFTGIAQFSFEEDQGATATDDILGLGMTYKGGPVAVGFSYTRLAAVAANGGDEDLTLGGSYDFGPVKVAAGYFDFDRNDRKGYHLGAGTNLGTVSLVLDVARQTTSGAENTDYLLEAKYPLSKRTRLYGVVYREGGIRTTSFSMGVRHNF